MWNLRVGGGLVLLAAAFLTFSSDSITVGLGLIWLAGAGMVTAAEVLNWIQRRL